MPRALVVEDHDRDAARLVALLAAEGFETRVCRSGAAVEEAVACIGAEMSVAFVSWEIPGPPFGAELLVRLRAAAPAARLVVVSRLVDARLATRAFALGAREFLEKPLDAVR